MLLTAPNRHGERRGGQSPLFRLFAFAGALALLYLFLAFGPVPELGQEGGVMRRNLDENVDATPLFYTDHDSLPALERELLRDRERRHGKRR